MTDVKLESDGIGCGFLPKALLGKKVPEVLGFLTRETPHDRTQEP